MCCRAALAPQAPPNRWLALCRKHHAQCCRGSPLLHPSLIDWLAALGLRAPRSRDTGSLLPIALAAREGAPSWQLRNAGDRQQHCTAPTVLCSHCTAPPAAHPRGSHS